MQGGAAMTQPVGNCPGCGGDEAFEQVHPGWQADDQCPDQGGHPRGECTEWVCSACGAGVFMGTVITGTVVTGTVVTGTVITGTVATGTTKTMGSAATAGPTPRADEATAAARRSVRAA